MKFGKALLEHPRKAIKISPANFKWQSLHGLYKMESYNESAKIPGYVIKFT